MSALPSNARSDELPKAVGFGREICGQLDQAERREWWLTNGRGAYAAGTLAGSLTRRYHGILVAPVAPPLGRVLVLAKADARLVEGEREWPLFTNRWSGGAVQPAGLVRIESFRLVGRIPTWIYAIGDIRIEQRIWLERNADRIWIAWRPVAGHPDRNLRLRVDLLVDARDHHGVTQGGHTQPELRLEDGQLRVLHHHWFELGIRTIGGTVRIDPAWVEAFDLPIERERGLEDRDDHLRVAQAELRLETGTWTGITAAVGPEPAPTLDLEESLRRQYARDAELIARARSADPAFEMAPDWIRRLLLAADDFIFARPLEDVPDGESVIAGYPWFGDWGRDTMIALPGLTLATGRPESARRILETFARFVDGGMLPNVFPGTGEVPEYNTVDAALWYLEAWRAYLETTGDIGALERVFPTLDAIVRAYRDGTRYGIGMDPEDGLIRAGEPGVQLTWMDAMVDGWVVTPRIGKPVEINALWYNGLVAMRDFALRLGLDPAPYARLAEDAAAGFQRYLRSDGDGLIDVLDGPEGDDASLRPNQIFAVSLPASPLSPEQQARVVSVCGRELLTSHGLRSLAPSHPDYRGRYLGDRWERDGAYHQGTVWGWLLGHYALAEYRVTDDAELALSRLEPMADHLRDAGLGSIGEIFDGDPPHTPRGTPLQAWSVACTLEAWWRLRRTQTADPGQVPAT
ncbi:amylo-alpha-1,6-glucosidase [Imhoffiella purpurea]|uniref:Glycogen debranching enzyme-related protein n=1 Tax=Imhoffiella purpurea TaxID=1249627 RepID=W9VWU5_9GAMM|nr:amylo-alpha-1,6-glucosidase [Imhoffiella purpurea]EXJ14880.1 glycogen debranching enzyme-related protein [Imhoffiella purpurea]